MATAVPYARFPPHPARPDGRDSASPAGERRASSRRLALARWRDPHLDAAPKPVGDADQAVEGEAGEVGVADALEIGRVDLREPCSGPHAQGLRVERRDDGGGELGLELAGAGVGIAEIGEEIARAADDLESSFIGSAPSGA